MSTLLAFFGAPGPMELIIIFVMLMLFIGVPVAVLIIVCLVLKKQNGSGQRPYQPHQTPCQFYRPQQCSNQHQNPQANNPSQSHHEP